MSDAGQDFASGEPKVKAAGPRRGAPKAGEPNASLKPKLGASGNKPVKGLKSLKAKSGLKTGGVRNPLAKPAETALRPKPKISQAPAGRAKASHDIERALEALLALAKPAAEIAEPTHDEDRPTPAVESDAAVQEKRMDHIQRTERDAEPGARALQAAAEKEKTLQFEPDAVESGDLEAGAMEQPAERAPEPAEAEWSVVEEIHKMEKPLEAAVEDAALDSEDAAKRYEANVEEAGQTAVKSVEAVESVQRAAADASVEAMEKASQAMRSAADETVDVMEKSVHSGAAGGLAMADLHSKMIEAAKANADAAFDLAHDLVNARTMAEAVEAQTTYVRRQFDAMNAQMRDMASLSTRVAKDMSNPVRTGFEQAARFVRREPS